MLNLLLASTAVAEHGRDHEIEATALGLNAGGWVALAMLVVFAIMIWKKVPRMIAKALDAKIAGIREQLAEAESLREEAEALKAEYEAKAADAESEAEAMIERARHEADEIVARAKTHAEALIDRRTRIAEGKIAAEERSAIDELRATAADAATSAAAKIIAERHDQSTDARLIDEAITGLATR